MDDSCDDTMNLLSLSLMDMRKVMEVNMPRQMASMLARVDKKQSVSACVAVVLCVKFQELESDLLM